MKDGPLDMRMDPTSGQSAAEWLARADVDDIAWVLKTFGEERFAKKIARAIVHDRVTEPYVRTRQLAEMIARVNPSKEKGKHAATRSFQAIRIYINSELDEIETALNGALQVLAPEGRLSVISFHSLEDRLVKHFIRKHEKGPEVPHGIPLTEAQLAGGRKLKSVGKALKPSEHEVNENSRSRSSVLRVAQRLAEAMSEVRVHLAREILGDLWRHKLQVVLAIAVLITAFAVILVTNMTRGLTAKQNDLMAEEDRLNIEWRHLLLEQGTLAEHSRVASLAMDKLQMARPLVTTEKVITQP